MDKGTFIDSLTLLDDRMKQNLSQYHAILKEVHNLEQEFCSCGFISEWIERREREPISEFYDFLITKMSQ